MPITDELLERILEKEAPLSSDFLWFDSATIESTDKIASWHFVPEDTDQKIFKPVLLRSIVMIPFLELFFFVLLMIALKPELLLPKIVKVLLVLLLNGTVLYFLFHKRFRRPIILDKQGITIDAETFCWDELMGTAILHVPHRRDGKEYLVLIRNDETYRTYNLANFYNMKGIKYELPRYIEYFRAKQ